MKLVNTLIVVCLLIMANSCKETPKDKPTQTDSVQQTETTENLEGSTAKGKYKAAQSTAVFKDSLVAKIYDQYIVLKTALVNSNQSRSALAADVLTTHFANIGVEEDVFTLLQELKEAQSLDAQRALFTKLTPPMEKLLEGAISEGVIYKQFCPMANNNTGAYWLSNSEEVYNPYFGDAMLHCGKVTQEITQ